MEKSWNCDFEFLLNEAHNNVLNIRKNFWRLSRQKMRFQTNLSVMLYQRKEQQFYATIQMVIYPLSQSSTCTWKGLIFKSFNNSTLINL